nr:unnamed protein product [Callosobruchus analis]
MTKLYAQRALIFNRYWLLPNQKDSETSPNEIGSRLLHLLRTRKEKGVQRVILCSGNCGDQHRNRFILSMFAYAAATLQITITYGFVEKGHTQNEGDSISAVYTPGQWITLTKVTKITDKPYSLEEMSQDDFFVFPKR